MTDRDIMQQALDALEIAEVDGNCYYEATELLRNRLAQPKQEPVAADIASIIACRDMLDAQPVPPRILMMPQATPPAAQRTWVGLTDEEMKKTWYEVQNIMGWYSFEEIARTIEAKLKEKNT